MPKVADTQPKLEPLARSLALFRHFEECGVVCCHFKSNEHLLEGLAGVTDLDLLIERKQARAGQRALAEAGFKRFAGQFASAYPAVEDYLGFDDATGRLIHAHVYYALVVGEPHLKGYRLGFDHAVLATRAVDPDTGVHTSHPNYEMLLLLIRFALKLRYRDYVGELLGRRLFNAEARREHAWLAARIERASLRQITEEQLGKDAGAMVESLIATPPSVGQLAAFRRKAAPALARYRSYGVLEGHPVRIAREIAAVVSGVNRRWLRLPLALRRTNPAGGCVIAFVGPDGAGKSTLVEEIRGWLGWKLDVHPVYFGSGDGPSSPLRWPLKLALRLLLAARGVRGARGRQAAQRAAGDQHPPPLQRRISPARALWALTLALEKRAKMRACIKARNRGMVVICDRYPQVQTMGFNDGPLLSQWLAGESGESGGSRLKRWLARWEFETYRELALTPPELLVKLNISVEEATLRKPETPAEEVERKRVAVRQIEYGAGSETLGIDATRPYEEVVLEVKRAIWARL